MKFITPPDIGTSQKENKQQARKWAGAILETNTAVILDSETTSFQGEIIELAIISLSGDVLFYSRFNPLSDIDPGATAVHGITAEMLTGCPSWGDRWQEIANLLQGKRVLIYNAKFDIARLRHTCLLHNVEPFITLEVSCLMERWTQYTGKRQALGGDHTAVGDCLASLEKLQEMAQ